MQQIFSDATKTEEIRYLGAYKVLWVRLLSKSQLLETVLKNAESAFEILMQITLYLVSVRC